MPAEKNTAGAVTDNIIRNADNLFPFTARDILIILIHIPPGCRLMFKALRTRASVP
jgi:hypothetical protein